MFSNSRAVALLLGISISFITVAFLTLFDEVPLVALIVAGIISFSISYLLIYLTYRYFIFDEIKRINQQLEKITDEDLTLSIEEVEKPAKKEEQVEPVPEPEPEAITIDEKEETAKDLIDYDDRAEFLKVVTDFFSKISKQIKTHHKNISLSKSQQFISGLLEILANNSKIMRRAKRPLLTSLKWPLCSPRSHSNGHFCCAHHNFGRVERAPSLSFCQ